ncbi:MAG: hypothetical protein FJY34_02800 [Betaproteobacteria bacterium]|nr:hypothetical protein [Betaproteobacteria bacterium]
MTLPAQDIFIGRQPILDRDQQVYAYELLFRRGTQNSAEVTDALALLPKEKFVLEVLETVELTPDVVRRCRALKDMGYTLALDDFVRLEEQHRPLLEMADIVKVELMGMDDAALRQTVAALRPWPVTLLAE